MVNVVGDHAIRHLPCDAPLTSDIAGLAGPVSGWIRTARSARTLAADVAAAVAAALGMLDLERPDLDWVKLAEGLGVEATRATSSAAFHEQLARALGEPGPRLIEAVL